MEKEKSTKIQMIFGYAVCLVAIIVFLICISSMVYSLIDLTDPFNAYRSYGKDAPSLASFNNYKVDIIRSLDVEHNLLLDDTTLEEMYKSARQDAISKVKHDAYRSLFVNGFIVVITILLFIFFWIWLKRLSRKTS